MDADTLIAFATAAAPDSPLWALTDSVGQTVAHAASNYNSDTSNPPKTETDNV